MILICLQIINKFSNKYLKDQTRLIFWKAEGTWKHGIAVFVGCHAKYLVGRCVDLSILNKFT
jgi:hypothetical protein